MKIPFLFRIYNGLLKHHRYRWLVMGASLLYLISPIDFSPDVIPIVAWIDDGVGQPCWQQVLPRCCLISARP